MIRLFVIFAIALTLIDGRRPPKVQVFEIHDTEQGLQIKKINPELAPDFSEFFLPKSSGVDKLSKQLIEKLKDVRGDDIYKVKENPNLFVMGKDLKPDENEQSEEAFVDETRNRPAAVQLHKDLLLQLMAPKLEKQQDSRVAPPAILRNGIGGTYDRTLAPRHKQIYESDEDY